MQPNDTTISNFQLKDHGMDKYQEESQEPKHTSKTGHLTRVTDDNQTPMKTVTRTYILLI